MLSLFLLVRISQEPTLRSLWLFKVVCFKPPQQSQWYWASSSSSWRRFSLSSRSLRCFSCAGVMGLSKERELEAAVDMMCGRYETSLVCVFGALFLEAVQWMLSLSINV